MKSKSTLWKTPLLLSCALVMGVTANAGGILSAVAEGAQNADSIEVERIEETGTYEGLVFKGTGLGPTASQKAVLCMDLTPDRDGGIALPTADSLGEKYLALTVTGLRSPQNASSMTYAEYQEAFEEVNPGKTPPYNQSTLTNNLTNAYDSQGVVIFMENGAHTTTLTNYYKTNPNYRFPAVVHGAANTFSYAQGANTGTSPRRAAGASNQLGHSTIFIPFSNLVEPAAANTEIGKKDISDVEYVMFAIDLGNPNRWGEYVEIAVVDLPGITVAQNAAQAGNGAFTSEEGTPSADSIVSTFEENKQVLVDFRDVTLDDIDDNFENGSWTAMMTGNRDQIKRSSCTYNNYAEYKKYIGFEKTFSTYSENYHVNIGASLDGALTFAMDPTTIGTTSTDKTASNYDTVRNAYLTLWEAQSEAEYIDVSESDGVAFKLMGMIANSAFRLYFIDDEGRAYHASRNNAAASPYLLTFTAEDGTHGTMRSYGNMLYADQKIGTAYFPYDLLTQHTDSTKIFNGQPMEISVRRIQKIAKILVALDNSANSAGIFNRKICIGTIADVDLSENKVTRIFNTAEYSYAEKASDTESDVNLKNHTAGKNVKPDNYVCAAGDTQGQVAEWKNNAWELNRVEMFDLLFREGIEQQYIGDVRVYEDFSLPALSGEYDTKEMKDRLVNKSVSANGATSYFSWYDNSERGYGDAYLWRIGDYSSEFQSGMSSNASWYTVATNVENYGSLYAKNAEGEQIAPKGVTLFVKNLRGFVIDMNVEVEFLTTVNGESKRERFNCCQPGSAVYAYDMNTNREFRMPSTAHATDSTISIPAGFEGWIRIPFSSLNFPNWCVTDNNYATDNVMDFEDTLNRFFINCNMNRNSTAQMVLDNFGFYYSDFAVKSSFHDVGKSIADCVTLNGFFGE